MITNGMARTTLFAALNVLDGTVIAQNMQRHRHQEFIRFLNRIEREVPTDKAVHVILDNYARTEGQGPRLARRHPRWTFHFTPTSCSLAQCRRGFFAKLTRRRLKYGVFQSVVDLQAAINRFVREYNDATQTLHLESRPRSYHRRTKQRVPNVGINPLAAADAVGKKPTASAKKVDRFQVHVVRKLS